MPVFVQRSPHFRPPGRPGRRRWSWSAPAPGSPRSSASSTSGGPAATARPNWLFFGEQHRATDFYYERRARRLARRRRPHPARHGLLPRPARQGLRPGPDARARRPAVVLAPATAPTSTSAATPPGWPRTSTGHCGTSPSRTAAWTQDAAAAYVKQLAADEALRPGRLLRVLDQEGPYRENLLAAFRPLRMVLNVLTPESLLPSRPRARDRPAAPCPRRRRAATPRPTRTASPLPAPTSPTSPTESPDPQTLAPTRTGPAGSRRPEPQRGCRGGGCGAQQGLPGPRRPRRRGGGGRRRHATSGTT